MSTTTPSFYGKQSISGIKLKPLVKRQETSKQTSKKLKTSPKKATQKLSPISEPSSENTTPRIPKLEIPISQKEIHKINELRELREQESARKVLESDIEMRAIEDAQYEKIKKQRERTSDRYNRKTHRERSSQEAEKKHESEMREKRKEILGLLTQPLTMESSKSRQFIQDLDRFSKPEIKVISPNFHMKTKREGLLDKIQQINKEIVILNEKRKQKTRLTQNEQKQLFEEYANRQKTLLDLQDQVKRLERKMPKSPTMKKPEKSNPRTKRVSAKGGLAKKQKTSKHILHG